jgi:hypothetical protein
LRNKSSLGVAVLMIVSTACGASAPANEADVKAAKACQAFYLYIKGTATGPETLNAIPPLLSPPSPSASATGAAKWDTLGRDLLKATGAAFTKDAKKLKQFGDKAASECASIPAAAKRKGGYNH